jgi:hypothetical protein
VGAREFQAEHAVSAEAVGAYRSGKSRCDLMAREKRLILDEIACPFLLVR